MMTGSEESGTLVGFTTLAPVAAGGLVGLLVARGSWIEPGIDWAAIVLLLLGILALIVSLLHLGRPWRAPLALLRVATSWLSREVLLFGLFLLLLGCYAILPVVNTNVFTRELVGFLGAIIGLASTVATGETYRLHARPSWDQWLTIVTFLIGALSTGILFGFFVAWQFTPRLEIAGYTWVFAAVFLVFSGVITCLRSIHRSSTDVETRISRQLVLGTYLWMLIVRVAGVAIAIIMIAMGGWVQYFAWIPALLADLADRILFFKTVVPVSLRSRYI